MIIRIARSSDAEQIRGLLDGAGLAADDVLAPGTRYWLAQGPAGAIAGAIGLEYGADAVLLRSAAVHPAARGQGLGAALVHAAIEAAARAGYRRAYMFSTDAGPYWARQGFREVPVPALVEALPGVPQVRHYEALGWLPTEVAWRRDLDIGGAS